MKVRGENAQNSHSPTTAINSANGFTQNNPAPEAPPSGPPSVTPVVIPGNVPGRPDIPSQMDFNPKPVKAQPVSENPALWHYHGINTDLPYVFIDERRWVKNGVLYFTFVFPEGTATGSIKWSDLDLDSIDVSDYTRYVRNVGGGSYREPFLLMPSLKEDRRYLEYHWSGSGNTNAPHSGGRDFWKSAFVSREAANEFVQTLRQAMQPASESAVGPEESNQPATVSKPTSVSPTPGTTQPQRQSNTFPRQESAAAEKDLDQAWSNLSPQQKNSIRQDERNWIKMKDGIPADDPRRAEEVRKRAEYLQSIQKNQPATSPPTTSTVTALDEAEQSLTQVYQQLWGKLTTAQRAALKASEIQWIKMKDGIPASDPRRTQVIQQRIEYLRSYGQSQ